MVILKTKFALIIAIYYTCTVIYMQEKQGKKSAVLTYGMAK